jgi:hypothetical protein
MKYAHALFVTVLLPCFALGSPEPLWWTEDSTRIIDCGAQVDNYAPLSIGQLKNVAVRAKNYLDRSLAFDGGSGFAVRTLAESFLTQASITSPDNYAPANLGQLKAVGLVFYDRLIEVGYDTKQNLIARGYPPSWSSDYPWSSSTPPADNYAPANIGQLKMVFSFDLEHDAAHDTDQDGLSDWYEDLIGTDETLADSDFDGLNDHAELPFGANPLAGDTDGDGLTDNNEFSAGRNPQKKDNPAVGLSVIGFTAP